MSGKKPSLGRGLAELSPLLAKLGARPETIAGQVQGEIGKLPKVQGGGGRQYATPRFEGVINRAWDEAQRLKDEYISTEHLLIAIAQEKSGAAAPTASFGPAKSTGLPLSVTAPCRISAIGLFPS